MEGRRKLLMADTVTPNYGWIQPDVGGDAATWGTTLNNDLALIDAQVYANQQAGVPVGTIVMFGGSTPPANWALCLGSSQSTTGPYATLFAVIGYAFGGSGANFNLPNLQGAFPIGASASYALGAQGGAATHAIAVAELPAHAHPIAAVTHTHGVTQSGHVHPDPGHTHGVGDPGHAHTVSVTGSPGYGVGAVSPPNVMTNAGAEAYGTTASGTGVSIAAAAANLQAANANVSIAAAATGLTTTQNTGSGTPIPTVPPYAAVNFIIRYQ
jgi:microcystin-dependent protein